LLARRGRWLISRRLFLPLAGGLLGTAVGLAQTTGGIAGRIVDASGAPLPGVTVEASGESLQGQRTVLTDRDGNYRLAALPPGLYRLQASLASFASVEKTVAVTLDATSTVRMTLQLSHAEEVLVSGEAPLLDASSTTTGTTYTSSAITHLPVGRNYADIVKANPGVVVDRGATQGRSLALAIYGSTSAENQWIIDGVNTTNVLKGIQGKAINSEFIQEVEVKTGGYQAEYGRALGGVVNVITKSGGNQFHGDGFLYYDSSALQARRVFNVGEDSPLSGMRLDDYRRTDFGADLGGFIRKDRLWFFFAYDRVSFPANVSRYEASPLVPTTMRFPLEGTDNLYSAKLTWNIGPGSTLVGTVFADPTTNSGAGAADPRQGGFVVQPITNPDPGTWESSRTVGATDYGLRFNQLVGSAGLLALQASRHQDRYELTPTGPGLQPQLVVKTCEGGTLEAACEIPQEGTVFGGFGFIGGATNHSSSRRDQLRADANLYRDSHEIKFGADYQDAQTSALFFNSGGQAITQFNEYGQTYYEHDFFARSPTDLTPVAWNSLAGAREFGAYVQDSWKVSPGLTVNAGLRWDQERIVDYRNVAVLRLTNEWQPRVGVVWSPGGNGVTKLYAFAGRFYYSLPTDIGIRSFGAYTGATTYNFDPLDVAPNPKVYKHESSLPFRNVIGTPVDAGLKGIYLDEYTLGVERLLGPSLSLGLKATYRNLGNAIEDRCDLDYNYPESNGSFCAIVNPGSSGRYARGDFHYCTGLDADDNCNPTNYEPLYGALPVPPAQRVYRGIELLARKAFSSRFWLQASYVFSSLRGSYDGEVSEGFNGQTDPGINVDFDDPVTFHNRYGRLYLDRPHSLRLDGFYATPFRLSIGLSAWLRSGAPLNKLGYWNGFSASYGFYPVQLVPKGYAGRLPMEWDANLTLEYPITLGPATVTLQAYLYNVFNNQIRTDQDTVWSSQQPAGYPDSIFDPNTKQTNSNYGLITARSDPRLFRAAIRISF
jgi:hypothetical protein